MLPELQQTIRKNRWIFVVANALLITFSLTSILNAAPVFSVSIHPSLGTIKERWRAESSRASEESNPTIILIEDAHDNFDAQKHIAYLIRDLVAAYGNETVMVGIEGARGEIDFGPLEKLPVFEAKKRLSLKVLKDGYLTGAEVAALLSYKPFLLFGVEDKTIFKRNTKEFRNLVAFWSELNRIIEDTNSSFASLKKSSYNARLREIETLHNKWHAHKTDIHTYARVMLTAARDCEIDIYKYPHLILFQDIQQALAALDQKVLMRDLEELAAALVEEKVIAENERRVLTPDSLYQPRIQEYVQMLWLRFGECESVNKAAFRSIQDYLTSMKQFALLDYQKLLYEFEEITISVKKALAANEKEKELVIADTWFQRLAALVSLNITRNALVKVPVDVVSDHYSLVCAVLRRRNCAIPSSDQTILRTAIKSATRFYSCAVKRDELLIGNLVRVAKKRHKRYAILVSGGFHSQGIINWLREKDFPYVRIAPAINNPAVKTGFMRRMTGQLIGTPMVPLETGIIRTHHLTENLISLFGSQEEALRALRVIFKDYLRIIMQENMDIGEAIYLSKDEPEMPQWMRECAYELARVADAGVRDYQHSTGLSSDQIDPRDVDFRSKLLKRVMEHIKDRDDISSLEQEKRGYEEFMRSLYQRWRKYSDVFSLLAPDERTVLFKYYTEQEGPLSKWDEDKIRLLIQDDMDVRSEAILTLVLHSLAESERYSESIQSLNETAVNVYEHCRPWFTYFEMQHEDIYAGNEKQDNNKVDAAMSRTFLQDKDAGTVDTDVSKPLAYVPQLAQVAKQRIGMVSARVGDVDGVSLEIEEWAQVFLNGSHDVHVAAADGKMRNEQVPTLTLPAEARFDHADNVFLLAALFPHMREESFIRGLDAQRKDIKSRYPINNGEKQKQLIAEMKKRIKRNEDIIKKELLTWIDRESITVIDIENITSNPYQIPLAFALYEIIAERPDIQFLDHCHDFYFDNLWGKDENVMPAFKTALRAIAMLRFPNVFRLPINSIRNETLAKDTYPHRSHVVQNVRACQRRKKRGEPIQEFLDDFNINLETDILMVLPVRIVSRKGIGLALATIRMLNEIRERASQNRLQAQSFKLLITGGDEDPGYRDWLNEYIEELGIADSVVFMEDQYDCNGKRTVTKAGKRVYTLEEIYGHADCGIYSSTFEGFGNALIELIMIAQVPIMLYPYPVFRKDIEGKGGFIKMSTVPSEKTSPSEVPLEDMQTALRYVADRLNNTDVEQDDMLEEFFTGLRAAAQNMAKLMADPEKKEQMVTNNLALANEHFSHRALDRILANVLTQELEVRKIMVLLHVLENARTRLSKHSSEDYGPVLWIVDEQYKQFVDTPSVVYESNISVVTPNNVPDTRDQETTIVYMGSEEFARTSGLNIEAQFLIDEEDPLFADNSVLGEQGHRYKIFRLIKQALLVRALQRRRNPDLTATVALGGENGIMPLMKDAVIRKLMRHLANMEQQHKAAQRISQAA